MSDSVYKLTYSNLSPPVVSLFCLSFVTGKRQGKVILSGSQEAQLPRFHYSEQNASSIADSYAEADDISVARSICVTVPACRPFLGVQEASLGCQRVQIEHWVDVAIKLLAEAQATAQFDFAKARYHRELLLQLEQHLASRTFIVGHKLSLADVALFFHFGTLFGFVLDSVLQREDLGMHTRRWWSYVFSVNPINSKVMNAVRMAYPGRFQSAARVVNAKPSIDNAPGNADRSTKRSCYEGKLPGAVQGKVVTRFPPEPSGYLHIGHAKAALLNAYYARLYGGKLLIRFDDTNPAKENMEYEQSIFEDLKLLDINVSEATRTSDYFEYLQTLCEDMLRKGLFYVDNTPVELMRQQRGEGIESVCRSHSVEQNLDLWNKMKEGTPEGTACCVRAKMNMQDKNKCLRDPVMYRCIVDIPHHIHGFKYKAYPTYDFACPVVDSLEGVTHAMRTNEYSDRIPQYQWVLDNCGLRHVTIYEFSRLNFVNTVLSKRKLQWFVDQGIVESWEDPRFPTVRGVRRRGLTVDALREFVLEQGPSKNTNLMEWDKLWAKNKQILDPILPRYTAVAATAIPAVLVNGPPSPTSQTRDLHPKNPSVGKGTQVYSSSILLDYDDAITLQQHEEITLMRWCNAIVESITYHEGQPCQITMRLHHDGDFKKTKKKLHWVASEAVLPAVLREFDHLITKKKLEDQDTIEQYCNKNSVFDTEALIEKDTLETLQHGACLQFERRGYFRLDALPRDDGTPAVFIKIPDGRSKNMSVVTSKVDAGVLAKGV